MQNNITCTCTLYNLLSLTVYLAATNTTPAEVVKGWYFFPRKGGLMRPESLECIKFI